jgi:3-hydroxy acid dehydrogenase / malonic semialdehyde reductase
MTEAGRALLTGASSGIGLAIAQRLLADGYTVTGISRRGKVNALASDHFQGISTDLSDLDAVTATLDELLQHQQFDCFIHAAGAGHFGSIEQFSVAQIEASIRLNLLSAMVTCRSLVPQMRRRGGGRIVFIGSESGLQAGRKGSLYSAAKFGLRGFCQALRQDCASDGIQVSLVNPGMVRSPFFNEQSFAPGAKPENAIEVEDVALAVAHILQSNPNIVIDEVNLSARVKSIDFRSKP